MFTTLIFAFLLLNTLVEAEKEMNQIKLNLGEDKPHYCREVGYLCGNDIQCCPGLTCVTETDTTNICDAPLPPLPSPSGTLRLLASWSLFGALVLMACAI